MMSEPVVLIVVSGSDIASTNQADELLLMHDWLVLMMSKVIGVILT